MIAARPSGRTLRLVWPQWQGAGPDVVADLYPDLPLPEARRAYALGTRVLQAILPPHDGPTAVVPVGLGDDGLDLVDGVQALGAVMLQLTAALGLISQHDPDRVVTLGGDCAVSVAPFSFLGDRYGDDLAIIWIDSHPDVGTPQSAYHGYHAMAVSALTGNMPTDVIRELPAVIDPARVALVGLHAWTEDDIPHVGEWGITAFPPDEVRTSSAALLEWLAATGCGRVAIHLDVDAVDSDEVTLGLGPEPGGLRTAEVRRIVADLAAHADIVGLTVAEYVPRQVVRLQHLLGGLPLLG